MIWILQIYEWRGSYYVGYPREKIEWLENKDHFISRRNAKYIIHDINTKSDGKLYDAMSKLSQDELKLLYSCKKALTPEQVVLYFAN